MDHSVGLKTAIRICLPNILALTRISINKTVEREKDILICEFKNLGSKLRKLKESDLSEKNTTADRGSYTRSRAASGKSFAASSVYNNCETRDKQPFQKRSFCENCNPQYIAPSTACCSHTSQKQSVQSALCCSTLCSRNRSCRNYGAEVSAKQSCIGSISSNESQKQRLKGSSCHSWSHRFSRCKSKISKNEGILQRKKKEICRADEILESKKKIINSDGATQSILLI